MSLRRRVVEARAREAFKKFGSLAPQPPKPRFVFVPYPTPRDATVDMIAGVVIDTER